MINRGLLLFLVFLLEFVPAKAQTLEETYAYAAAQQELRNYTNAIESYNRVVFFDAQRNKRDCFKRLGDCYRETREYDKAAKNYDIAYSLESNDSAKLELLFRKTGVLLLQQKWDLATVELFNLPDSLGPRQKKSRDLYLAITAFGKEDYAESERLFLSVAQNDPAAQLEIRKLFLENKKISRINPKKAMVLSYLLPGLGQLYAGDYKNAANSILLTSAFMALFVVTAINYSFIEASFSILPWFQRYYTGGAKKAAAIAAYKKEMKRRDVYRRILLQAG